LLSLTFARNETGALTGVGDAVTGDRGASFGYADDGRLQYAVGAWGDESYAYDPSGNRTEVRRDDGSTVSYEFALTSPTRNRITEVRDTGWSLLRDLSYRDGGDLYAQDYTGGSDFEYHYGARKRLLGVSENSAVTASYSYDYLGRRVARTLSASGQTIHYVFDDQGRLHGEYDGATGQFLKEYVWLDDRLTAVITPGGASGVIWFVHTGQIAEPLLVTNASGAVAWSAVTDPGGQAALSGAPLVGLDLRLPGQWLHAETGLHQNWMRDYDPTLGRYIQADPIGWNGGSNLYAYVAGDPLNISDPGGLQFAPPIVGPRPLPWIGRAPSLIRPTPAIPRPGTPSLRYYPKIEGVQHPNDTRPNQPDQCAIVLRYCITHCTDRTLPTMGDGWAFVRCKNKCMDDFGCLNVVNVNLRYTCSKKII
jgi:RHS repeat-associated protein